MTVVLLLSLLVLSPVSCLPPGHGNILGEHNNLGSPALEEDFSTMTSKHFYQKYVSTRTPVILRGLSKTFPAFHRWTDEYIKEKFGDLEVRLEAKTEKSSHIPLGEAGLGRASFSEFFSRYQTDNMYCVSEVPSPMYEDLVLPALMNCGSMSKSLVEMNLWINSGGAKSIIHKDAHNQLNCLLDGSKDWIFINNRYNDGIYQAEEIDGDQGGFSLINPDKINYVTFPKFAKVPWEYATVQAGDCLYLPPRYYHRVTSTDRNFAVSYLFGTLSEFQMDDCDVATQPLPLEDAQVQWKYPGHGVMSMGNSGPEEMKRLFIEVLLEMSDNDRAAKIPVQKYTKYLVDDIADEMPYIRRQFEEVLNVNQSFWNIEFLDIAHLNSLPVEFWYAVAAAFSYEPSNDPNNEMFYISKSDVVNVLKNAAYYSGISEDTFSAVYRGLNGSLRVARELFGLLSRDGGETVTWYDVIEKDHVFDVFGRDHDRGDGDMQERNDEHKRKAEQEMRDNVGNEKSEL